MTAPGGPLRRAAASSPVSRDGQPIRAPLASSAGP